MELDDLRTLRRMLDTRPVGALGTLHGGEPAVSMVPFVLPAGQARLVIHVSALSPHTRDMQEHPRVSLLVMAETGAGVSPQELPRVALQADAASLPRGSESYESARASYLERFPDTAEIFELGDFSIVELQPVSARLVAGFGRATSLVGEGLATWLVAASAAGWPR